ncbi:hypothetical protein EDB89DRAFT_327909 [Lactarius sanguifluus]|nr:hypothetical protein EDB89DRAFT_327909 [Lactarius sanguifluus]
MYLEMAEQDKNMADGLKADADRVLIFSGLFSAVIATFLEISVQDLRPDPQDKPAFYLENIYQLLSDSNRTDVTTSFTQSHPPTFSPQRSAVWVNSLWFLSLAITLSCALLALLLQEWTRRYIKLTQPRSASSPHQRARIRAFFDKGIEDLHLRWTVDALPILLHASLALFLAGLLVFTIGSNHTVFKVVASWVVLCTVIYAYFTLIPIFRCNSPYYTPLSSPLWLLYTGTLCVAARILRWLTAFNCCNDEIWHRFGYLKDRYQRQFFHGLEQVTEECAQKSSSEIDGWVLLRTLQSSHQDHVLEQLFEIFPGFCNSRVFNDLFADFKMSISKKMAEAVVGLMHRTLSSGLLPQSTKQRRITICHRAMAEASLPINCRTLERVLHKDWSGLLYSVDFGLMLTKARYSDPFAEYYSQCVVSIIISRVQEYGDRWFEFATGHLGISKTTLQTYLRHGDSMLLANCIFICRRTMEDYSKYGWRCDVYSRSKTLELVSRLDFQETLPELQREFCDMWNELVRSTGNQLSRNLSIYILKHIRNIYCGIHQSTDAAPRAFSFTTSDRASILLFPQSYPFCTITLHRPAKGPSPEDVPFAPQSLTPVAMPAYTPRIIRAAGSENRHLQPVSDTFGVIEALKPPSYLLRGIRDCTKMVPNTLDANAGATAHVHTPSASLIALRHNAILETFAPLATHDASLIPTSSTCHVGIASADIQPVNNEPCISQQCISVARPSRAVLRSSPVNDDLIGLLANITHGNTSTSASSTASSFLDVSGAVSTFPHSLTDTFSSIGYVAPRNSEDPQSVPTHTVLDTPLPSFPIPVLVNAIPVYSQSSPMSFSDDIPSGKRLLTTRSATVLQPTTPLETTILPQQEQSALFSAKTPDFQTAGHLPLDCITRRCSHVLWYLIVIYHNGAKGADRRNLRWVGSPSWRSLGACARCAVSKSPCS